jgi:hypothetical protein
MKKALIFLLSLAVVGAVFAQDAPTFTLGGSLQTGLVYQMGDDYVDPLIWNYADDAGKDAYRARLDGKAVNGSTGVKFRFQSDSGNDLFVKYAFAYVDLLDSLVTVQSGYGIDENNWRTTGDLEFDYEGSGVKVMVKPIEGLNFGAMLVAPTLNTKAVELGDATYIFGFAYAMAPFGVQAGAKFDLGEAQGVYGGFNYDGLIPGLTLTLETLYTVVDKIGDVATGATGLGDYSDFGVTKVVESVEYTTDMFDVGVYAYEFMYGDSDSDMGLKVKPYAAYKTGIYTVKLEVAYVNDEVSIMGDWTKVAFEKEDVSLISVKPTITVQFTDKTKLVSGYEYVAFTDMAADNAQKLFTNFRFDF